MSPSMANNEHTAILYRRKAADLRELAATFMAREVRFEMLATAEQWDRLANGIELTLGRR